MSPPKRYRPKPTSTEQIEPVCPRCQSPMTQTFEEIYNQGTSNAIIKGEYFSNNWGVYRGRGQSMTQLARHCAPPQWRKPGEALQGLAILIAILGICLAFAMIFILGTAGFYFFLLSLLIANSIAGLLAYQGHRINQQANAKNYAALDVWLTLWHCRKCGHDFSIKP